MHRAGRALFLLVVLLTVMGAALPDAAPADDPIAENRRLLELWKQNPEHHARLQRDLQRFWSLPREERDRLRALDRELREEDPAIQKRLLGVLERYHVWLEKLPESERRKVENTPEADRAALIRRIREQQWTDRLSLAERTKLADIQRREGAQAAADEVARLKEAQRQRALDVQRAYAPVRPAKKDKPVRLNEFPIEVQFFVRDGLMPLLTPAERESLRKAEGEPWPAYARKLHETAQTHPIPFPGSIGPVRIADLPFQLERIVKNSKMLPSIRKEEGRWPEFGVAVLSMPQYRKHQLSRRFLPTGPSDFSDEIQDFISALPRKLPREDHEKLLAARGKWPDYPRTLLEVSKKHGLEIPGMKLPGPRELWEAALAGR